MNTGVLSFIVFYASESSLISSVILESNYCFLLGGGSWTWDSKVGFHLSEWKLCLTSRKICNLYG